MENFQNKRGGFYFFERGGGGGGGKGKNYLKNGLVYVGFTFKKTDLHD